MSDFTLSITDQDIDRAMEEARLQPEQPHATSVEYVGGKADIVLIRLNTGGRLTIPRENLEGLQNATEAELSEIRIWGPGTSISWPKLDVDHYVPNLLKRRYGGKAWMEQLQLRVAIPQSQPAVRGSGTIEAKRVDFSVHSYSKERNMSEGLDGRHRDADGRISEKHGNTLVSSLRETYGPDFLSEWRSDAHLETVRAETGKSLTQLVEDFRSHR